MGITVVLQQPGPNIPPSLVVRPAPKKQRIVVSPWVFICCWWCVLLTHLSCAVFIGLVGAVHELTAIPEIFTYTASALQIPRSYLLLAARTFLVITCFHWTIVFRIVYHSIRRRQLCFHGKGDSISNARHNLSQVASVLWIALTPLRVVRQLWSQYLGIDGLFGLNGKHFDVAFSVREVFEAMSQMYQAYFFSAMLASVWVNRLAVTIIVVGCWSAPLIHVIWRHSASDRRFASLVVDLLLDLAGSVGIPVFILARIVADVDWHAHKIPRALTYNSVWMANSISQAQLLYVWSVPDYFFTVILQLSVLGSLITIASALERRTGARVRQVQAAPQLVDIQQPTKRALSTRKGFVFACIDAAFLVGGILILCIHVRANRFNTEDIIPSCALGTHSWLATKPGCAVIHINCHRLGIAGAAEEITSVLSQVERSTAMVISFRHCSGLVMPDIIQEFRMIQFMDFVNITLLSWPLTAALHRSHHNCISYIFLGHVNVTEFPIGLLHPDLPLSLTDLGLSYTNVTVLPESVGEYWSNRPWSRVLVEHGALKTLPRSLARVAIRRLSVVGNEIASIPDDLFANQAFEELYLSGNPLQSLPTTMGDTSQLRMLFVEHTLVSTTPLWWNDWWNRQATSSSLDVRLYGSGLCDTGNDQLTPPMRESGMCAMDTGTTNGTYTWDIAWRLRPVQ